MLKKSTSFLLSVFILAQSFNIQLSDILKLKDLLEHIQYHESAYGDDFFAFFSKHYGNRMIAHKDAFGGKHDHDNLPFHHRISVDSGHLYVFEIAQPIPELSEAALPEKADYCYHNFYSFLDNSEIFQPPRKA